MFNYDINSSSFTFSTKDGYSGSAGLKHISGYLRGATPQAETEFPTTRTTSAAGWTEVSDIYRVPSRGCCHL